MKFDLTRVKARLELLLGREVSWREISTATDIHYNTLYNIASNKQARADLDTLARLIEYFRTQGLDVGPGDLFVVERQAA